MCIGALVDADYVYVGELFLAAGKVQGLNCHSYTTIDSSCMIRLVSRLDDSRRGPAYDVVLAAMYGAMWYFQVFELCFTYRLNISHWQAVQTERRR